MTFTPELDLDIVVTYLHDDIRSIGQVAQKLSYGKKMKLLAAVTLHWTP